MPPPLQNFIDQLTVVKASWLNPVDVIVTTVFEQTSTKSSARAALVDDLTAVGHGFEIVNGGTGATDGLNLSFRGVDSGVINAYIVTTTGLANPLSSLNVGTIIRAVVNTVNNGAATITLNGFGPFAITDYLGNALTGGELTGLQDLFWTGTAWRMRSGQITVPYKRTAAEIATGITPASYFYQELDIRRYGADPSGGTDSTTAINNAVTVAAQVASAGTLGAGPSVVIVPCGNYKISSSIILKSYVTLQGVYGEDGSFGVSPFALGSCLNFTATSSGAATFTVAPTGSGGTLTAAWAGVTGLYLIVFSDGERLTAQFTNGSTAVTWFTPITGAPTTAVTVLTPLITCFNSRLARVEGLFLQCNGGANTLGILMDCTNTPSGDQNEFHRISFRNFFLGVQWGTSGLTNAFANDARFVNCTLWSTVTGSTGFIINSGNAGDQSLIDYCGIEVQNMGIYVEVASILKITRCFGGNNLNGGFIVCSTAVGLTIAECSSEGWGGNPAFFRSANSSFLNVVAPQGGFAVNNFAITMIQNQINNPIIVNPGVGVTVRLISVGDNWGQCQNTTFTGIINATGTFLSGLASLVMINNGTNGSIDVTTGPFSNTPTMGWQDSAFVDIARFDPLLGAFQPSFTATSYSGNGAMTWTVANVNATFVGYTLMNRIMTIYFNVTGSTIGGTPNTDLTYLIPAAKVPSQSIFNTCIAFNNGVQVAGLVEAIQGNTLLRFRLLAGGNWTASAGNAGVQGQISFVVN